MVDHCEITRPGKPAIDPATGKATSLATQVYLGPCRITTSLADEIPRESAGATMNTEKLTLQLPAETLGIRVNDTVTITDTGSNPTLMGLKVRVATILNETFATSAKFTLEALT